jgi:hypothetical protein
MWSKRQEVIKRKLENLLNEVLHNLYSSQNFIRVNKSNDHEMGKTFKGEMHTKFLSENLKGRDYLGALSIDSIILK